MKNTDRIDGETAICHHTRHESADSGIVASLNPRACFQLTHTMRILVASLFVLSPLLVFSQNDVASNVSAAPDSGSPWTRLVSEDGPELWWRFNENRPLAVRTGSDGTVVEPAASAAVDPGKEGVSSRDSRLFGPGNHSASFNGKISVLKYKDPGEKSVFDFDLGDALTIEAWIRLDKKPGGFIHILSKGRTGNAGFPTGNQNYAFRIDGGKGDPRLSFLFRSRDDKVTKGDDFHRWTSNGSFVADGRWHHVGMVYEFGKKDSIKGYIDGRPTDGTWDLKGATSKAPIVDDDELWVGSALNVSPGSTFNGLIDEIVVYRKALSADRFAERYPFILRTSPPPMPEATPPRDAVLVEVIEGVSDKPVWPEQTQQPNENYREPAFAFFEVPPRYDSKGLRTDRANPLILRASSRMTFEPGEYRLLLRTLRFGRVFLDGKPILETPQRGHRGGGHNAMYELDSPLAPGSRQLFPGAVEKLATIKLDGEHEIRVELFVGGQGRRLELGETSLSIARGEEPFRVLSPKLNIPLTDHGWTSYEHARRNDLIGENAKRRRVASRQEDLYWQARHAAARKAVDERPPITLPNPETTGFEIDRFILARLDKEKIAAERLVDDWQFLRRVSFDTIGTPPSPALIKDYFAAPQEKRRAIIIDRLLADDGWADRWVGYWQDALAENPNIINPTLNNTGPFRWWIYESFIDNKPFDRFATELILMEGSERFGGPAGFEIASQNDAPFAAKAHIVGQAFLSLEMKCARCHDAPYHDFDQKDLFSIAAMLSRSPQGIPKTSTIPGGVSNSSLVKVSLKAGEKIQAAWPFGGKLNTKVSAEFLRSQQDSREELAARVTSPLNDRFAKTIVNRMWQRYIGRGFVATVDDWEGLEPSHPELLAWLSRELVRSGYDLKHVARLIFNSHTYQREVDPSEAAAPAHLFASPVRRRLSAEQLVDSVFAISGKQFRAGDMNIDHDGSREQEQSINLGIPRRAWMFSSTSNERDRPSLALPFAQPFITTLESFGWRSSRQNPLTVRDEESNVLQPAIVANGVLGRRFTRLSDDSTFTQMALEARPVSELVRSVYERTLTREPTSDERALFVELLSEGYADRIDKTQLNAPAPVLPGIRRTGVGWSNHLKGAASDVQIAAEETVRQGDPPTKKLHPEWRERFEDMLWALMNSPEFIFIP